MYKPNPIDTGDVVLPDEILELIEDLAENVHEVWASQRIQEGWTYGEKRDNDARKTPCLVPYDQLPEFEKEYDRSTALATIKFILKQGYQITRKEEE